MTLVCVIFHHSENECGLISLSSNALTPLVCCLVRDRSVVQLSLHWFVVLCGTDLSLPAAASSSRVPSLGLVLYLLKSSAAHFSRYHQSHRQSLGKLQGLDQLPPEELKEVSVYSLTLLSDRFCLGERS